MKKYSLRILSAVVMVAAYASAANATDDAATAYLINATEAAVATNNCAQTEDVESFRSASRVLASASRLTEGADSQSAKEKRIEQFSKNSARTTVDTRGCKLIKVTNASCYGRGDVFARGHLTSHGLHYKPSMMSAAYPEDSMLYAILVVRNPKTGIAREIVITDKGPSHTMQTKMGRGIDLSAGAMDSLGIRCPNVIKGLEIYNCAGRANN